MTSQAVPKVEAVPAVIRGQAGYDIRINDPEATVQDYIDALNEFIEKHDCSRSRNPGQQSCYGCDLCCRERIPVTLVDIQKMPGGSLREVFSKVLHVSVEGPVVDITVALDREGKCCFLDAARGLCSSYAERPMVCQTFICCPSTGNASKLREEVVNAGEDELVRTWFKVTDDLGRTIIHEAASACPCPDDYAGTAFYGKSDYSQVLLREICSPRLWKKLLAM